MKIQLPIDWEEGYGGGREWLVVPAEIVFDIAPHLASVATFAVHKTPPYYGRSGGYQITNVETGFRVGESRQKSKAAAISTAKKKMTIITVQRCVEALNKANKIPHETSPKTR